MRARPDDIREHVAVAVPLEASRHPADRLRLGSFDVDLHQIDAIRLAVVEQRVEANGL